MTTGLDGILDIRQKNDMLNALRFLVEYTGPSKFLWPGKGNPVRKTRESRTKGLLLVMSESFGLEASAKIFPF